MILKAVKKQIEIQVIRAQDLESHREQFHIELDANGYILNQNTQEYRRAVEGDYINVTDPNDIYPIPRTYFEENYVIVGMTE